MNNNFPPSLKFSFAHPNRFLSLTGILAPICAVLAFLFFAVGLSLVWRVPDDYQQGAMVKIMFIHVPSVWMAMLCYVVMVISALGVLVWRHPLADVASRCSAPLGATFTFLGLATGSLWGRPIWGTWWEWDARLTSFFVLFLIYLALMALWRAIEEPASSARIAAIAVLVGAINLPIIKFSVDWFVTLHQPASVLRRGGPAMESVYLYPLLLMALAFLFLFIFLHFTAMKGEIHRRQIRAMHRRMAKEI